MNRGKPRVSVIINNYNYARFLRESIQSVLEQTVPPFEIIVVDDGSTDNSLELVKEFGRQVTLIAKKNGGQASAFNAGFAASSGEWIWFLDADDWLDINAIDTIGSLLHSNASKIQGHLIAASETGASCGSLVPEKLLSEGNIVNEMIEQGGYSWPPTSGNVFARWALQPFMPMPEVEFRLCADLYVCNVVAMQGEIRAAQRPLGFYRMHGNNSFHGFRLEENWLTGQAKNILQSASLTQRLIREHTDLKSFEYRYSRRNVELLMIAKRFTLTGADIPHSKGQLYRLWQNSQDVVGLRGMKKIKGLIYWMLLSLVPKSITKAMIGRAHRKLDESKLIKSNGSPALRS